MRISIRMRCTGVGIGSLTLVRLFPEWFWKAINAPYRVTEGLGYHFFFMWIFAINGIVYVRIWRSRASGGCWCRSEESDAMRSR